MSDAPRIKLFVAILAQPNVDQKNTTQLLAEVFGSVDYVGPQRLFDCTDYYEKEMGPGLVRYLVSFTGPHFADILPGAKRACIALEQGCAISEQEKGAVGTQDKNQGQLVNRRKVDQHTVGRRTVNLNIGYIDHHKVVLASTKAAGHKVYLGDGIYADVALRFAHKVWQPLPWSFSDFTDGRYNEELTAIRALLILNSAVKEDENGASG